MVVSDTDTEGVEPTERERLIITITSEVTLRLLQLRAIDPAVLAAAVNLVGSAAQRMLGSQLPNRRLSRRQQEVLRLLLNGLGNKEIGQELGISSRTVEVHRKNIMKRLGCTKAAELADASRAAGYAFLS